MGSGRHSQRSCRIPISDRPAALSAKRSVPGGSARTLAGKQIAFFACFPLGLEDMPDYLSFTFAPHILEDLGVNLYTSVSKALVEFVANAHDADAASVDVKFDFPLIKHGRTALKADYDLEKNRATTAASSISLKPLEERTLPESIELVIEDTGDGMTRTDLQTKFLVIGRRRRKGKEKSARTSNNRIIMGRKGLGKLAGFGIAHVIEVTSKVASEAHATRITLDLDSLLNEPSQPVDGKPESSGLAPAESTGESLSTEQPAKQTQSKILVEKIEDGAGLVKGTRIVLRKLVYDALRGDFAESLKEALSENFYGIKTEDFAIRINGAGVDTATSDFAYAFPQDDTEAKTALIKHVLESDVSAAKIAFAYRIRFRPSKQQLPAKGRGVRVYAHHRLASMPDLLDVKSSAHGFQYTSYLDGIVVADFIDEQPTDFISTDRQSLRWDTPILSALREFLTIQMTKGLAAYADSISNELGQRLRDDNFTKLAIAEGKLPSHREATAWQIAKTLAGKDSGNLESDFYRNTIKSVISGLGHGEILATIQSLADQDHPELMDVIREITRLTRHEFDEFVTIIDARLRAIQALSKLVSDVSFTAPKNEGALHELFEKNPWLIDPTFFEFLTSDKEENELARKLSQELKIGKYAPTGYDPTAPKEVNPLETNERPDLTFLLSNRSLKRLVIVELKAPNTPLHSDHLTQLKGYMRKAELFFAARPEAGAVRVEGILIGSRKSDSGAEKVQALDYEVDKFGPNTMIKVFDIGEVLTRTRDAHAEILNAHKKASSVAAQKVTVVTSKPVP